MKVLYISDPVTVGGATRSLFDVVTGMQERGVDVIVCTSLYNDFNKELNKICIANIACGHMAMMEVRVPSLKYYLCQYFSYHIAKKKAIKAIEENIDLHSIDLIHTNSSRNDIGMELSKKYGIKHICHLREFGREDFNCWCYRRNYIEFFNRYTNRFIAISNAVKEGWIKKGINKDNISVIYNGVSDESIIPRDRFPMLSDKKIKIVIVGGVCSTKGQEQAIDALSLLDKSMKNYVYLDIIGWGADEYINYLKEKTKRYDLTNNIEFLGARNDIGVLLQNYHIGLMCSKSEGFGRVTAEYMHAGLGVIASHTGANTEIVDNNITGLIYQYGNSSDLAKCIERYYNDRRFLLDCAIKGQEKAKLIFTKNKNVDNILSTYKEVLNG